MNSVVLASFILPLNPLLRLCSYEWLLPRVGEVAANHRELPIRLPPLQPGQHFEDVYDVSRAGSW